MPSMTTLLIIVLTMVIFSWVIQRPLKKQAEAAREMREQLAEGTRVILTSGLFGTVSHVGSEQVIVELAPGMEVTCAKTAIAKLVGPDEEEFVFSDDEDLDEAELENPDLNSPELDNRVLDNRVLDNPVLDNEYPDAGEGFQRVEQPTITQTFTPDTTYAPNPAPGDNRAN